MNEPLSESIEHIIQQGLDVSPDCFGILNPEGKVIFCNNTFADAYGVSKETAIGKSNKELLKLAWENKKGITINTDDFELWYKKIEDLYKEKKLNQFETDFIDGRWFKMTRTNLTNGYIILFGSDISDLKNTQNHLEQANLRVEALAITDQLTGINNRRSMDTVSEHEIKRARRYKQPLSVLMLDLDHFKFVNDNYGHDAGDFILREFASLCTQQLRETDFIFRVGGEEFTVLLPMADIATAYTIGERIRLFTDSHIFYFKELNQKIDISVSIGISCFSGTFPSFKELMTQADKALYKAKQNGRNQVCVYSK